jgi:hypothetical protein
MKLDLPIAINEALADRTFISPSISAADLDQRNGVNLRCPDDVKMT